MVITLDPMHDESFTKISTIVKRELGGDGHYAGSVEPRYFNDTVQGANDQHPPHDVRVAEALVADVYNTLRGSRLWDRTLFIVVYDEHGGFYDHVPPPTTVNPDGRVSASPRFAFDRLGVRVPTLLISPWVPKNAVDNAVYDHTSILGFLKRNFGLGDFLYRRDAVANTFEQNFLESPRDDCPTTIEPESGVKVAAGASAGSMDWQQTTLLADATNPTQKVAFIAVAF